jgi:hypothetical protein
VSEPLNILSDQTAALFVGAVLLAVFQTAKFRELDITDPTTARLISFLPSATAKDFAGRTTYYFSLVLFVVISLSLYYLVCRISPDVLKGAIKQTTGSTLKDDLGGSTYPLYVAALFMGLTQPVIPGLGRAANSLRNFFHDRIDVPRRVIDLTATLSTVIDRRSDSGRANSTTKRNLTKEVKALTNDAWLVQLQSCGDLNFYKEQLRKIKLGDPVTVAATLKDSSVKDLREFIDQLVLFNLIAVIRKSGPRHLGQIAKWARTNMNIEASNIGMLLMTLALSSLFFGFSLAAIWLFFDLIRPAAVNYFHYGSYSLWPKPDWLGIELARIVPAIFVGIFVPLYMVTKDRSGEPKNNDDNHLKSARQHLAAFTQSTGTILLTCFAFSLAINFFAEAYQYAVSHRFADVITFQKFAMVFVRTAPSMILSYCALLYLSPRWQNRRHSFLLMMLIVILGISTIAMIVALMFLHLDFLPALPDFAALNSGWDYVIFYVSANVLVSVCVFSITVLFFHAQNAAPVKAMQNTLRRRHERRMLVALTASLSRPTASLMRSPGMSRRSKLRGAGTVSKPRRKVAEREN